MADRHQPPTASRVGPPPPRRLWLRLRLRLLPLRWWPAPLTLRCEAEAAAERVDRPIWCECLLSSRRVLLWWLWWLPLLPLLPLLDGGGGEREWDRERDRPRSISKEEAAREPC